MRTRRDSLIIPSLDHLLALVDAARNGIRQPPESSYDPTEESVQAGIDGWFSGEISTYPEWERVVYGWNDPYYDLTEEEIWVLQSEQTGE